ncbi:phosphate/phosphite/phosphonate ABC transporter substrate-binding protein [Kamptonema formosum]|uniref:phosphate/phosphite/phosphonate ABC transporter substrate-binding protein n=1 Tax=Kamptonema formosum TaxID=331992 RepID=UPI00036ED285|nr:phosphate/phosphite/phosphonate ABC transporter substrate-binding protein [Oscillatoria sp. PCC 10802]
MKRRSFLWNSLLFLTGCAAAKNKPNSKHSKAYSRPNKLRFAVSDTRGMEELQRDYEPFRRALAEVLETEIEFFPLAKKFTAAGSAMQLNRVDLMLVGPAEYAIVSARTNAVPVIALTRPGFHSVIAVRADSGIKSLQQLKGKTIALREVGSTSGHLSPTKLLLDAGLNPQSDVKILMLDDKDLKALKNGEVDAWAGSIFKYQRTLQAAGLSEKEFPAIAAGPPLPNDIFIASSHLDPAFVEEVRDRMFENQAKLTQALVATPLLSTRFQGSKLVPANDADYNPIREAYKAIGQGDFFTKTPAHY